MRDDAAPPAAASIDESSEPATLLVRISAAIAGLNEISVRQMMADAAGRIEPALVEEVILQSYLFAGFPRSLNAARAWRSASGHLAPAEDSEPPAKDLALWRKRGEETCKVVYGDSYDQLRQNIRRLHPALDEWMILDGYGKVLSRPGVDLRTRELCVVAACAVSGQQRQLHSHLHGAFNAGASAGELAAVLDALTDLISRDDLGRYRQLLQKVAVDS